jgi:hypothetical protein
MRNRPKVAFDFSGDRATDRIGASAIGELRLDKSRDMFGSRHGARSDVGALRNSAALRIPVLMRSRTSGFAILRVAQARALSRSSEVQNRRTRWLRYRLVSGV